MKKTTLLIIFILIVVSLFYFEIVYANGQLQSPFLMQEYFAGFNSQTSIYNSSLLSGFPKLSFYDGTLLEHLSQVFENPIFVFFCTSLGLFALLVYLGVNRVLAAIFGIAGSIQPKFLFLGYFGETTSSHFFVFLPWVLFCLLYLKRYRNLFSFSVLALVLGFALKFGSNQSTYLLLLFLVVYTLVEILFSLGRKRYFKLLQFLIFLYFALFLALAFSLDKFFLIFEQANNFMADPTTPQRAGYDFLLNYILPAEPSFIPNAFSIENWFYFHFIGLFPLSLFFLALFKAKLGFREAKLLVIGALFLILFVVFAKFENSLHLLPFSQVLTHLEYLLLFTNLIVFVVAALGANWLIKRCTTSGETKSLFLPFFIGIIVFAIYLNAIGNTYANFDIGFFHKKILPFELALLVFIAFPFSKIKHGKIVLLILFFVGSVLPFFLVKQQSFRFSEKPTQPPKNYFENLFEADTTIFRVFPLEKMFTDNRYALYSDIIGGNQKLKLKNYWQVLDNALETEFINNVPINWNVASMLNVKYFIRYDEPMKIDKLNYFDYDVKDRIVIYKNEDFLPRAWFVGDLQLLRKPQNIIKKLNNIDFSPKNLAILSTNFQEEISIPKNGSIKFKSHKNGKISLEVFSDTATFLVLSEIFYPQGWTATLNGEPVTPFQTNLILMGFFIPKGKHTLNLDFEFHFSKVANLTSLVSIALILILLIFGIVKKIRYDNSGKTYYVLKYHDGKKRLFF